MNRRLPIYLLLDCSESMAGEAIEAVTQGTRRLIAELQANPLALETTYVSILTFSRGAQVILPLTEVPALVPPNLKIRPGTSLGAVLQLLEERMDQELIPTSPTTKGDYKPFIFLLTDGQPTDAWDAAARHFRDNGARRAALIYAIGCGPDVDTTSLHKITDTVLLLKDVSPETIKKFFFWVSASVQMASASVGTGDNRLLNLPSLPLDIIETSPQHPAVGGAPRQVFLHARCNRTSRPYLMRFARVPHDDYYLPVKSHPLEELEEGDGEAMAAINVTQLAGCPPCPYCENTIAAMCECGKLFCSDGTTATVRCPHCHNQMMFSDEPSQAFDIRQSQG